MRHHTVTTTLAAPPDDVFAYLADVKTHPEWATEFARELIREGDIYKVRNGLGEFFFEIRADAKDGVIDMFAGLSRDALDVFPTRVVELPDGRSAYSFTMFQGPDMPDELFEAQHESLKREFKNIERRFAS